MPRQDGTGPFGMGAGTGKGFGPCGLGMGWRRKFGGKRGLGRYFNWNWGQSKEEELKALSEYKEALQEELEDLNKEEMELKKK
ncbi:hypothetical protein A2X44_04685 [candidate division CPR3 bacterium GWF2_35_18]|uniref:Cytoplasmic protein n=1 Tax=candidate division CPR3 bacterium GW2011_GWF2_35_18 TaxID=1618350 RepID=A0A0G0C0U6_UNCC3|nr:MAG: hypothetical protein UR67_C0003G0019 [candidate division CPR3 bacterium GW2011_GWF2_35_18]KKP86205.1 MAG: hypothetical protein UR87_C0026G0007 [candidate division CPR3 bacterium GW2011_GWE2_35_7]OGB63631.1 MAG: hypothetical protein A2X44_04685 [candidate division CPR3 bacterium GWF2_35_18]OGB64174.1 MAG: hypothetical protein A2250_02560 [candidate division CPR3 bacterium RIFOXYA2_FULL_35_13]OGB78377.1 MAG: hypothetical protein A2296_02755 [candidate division CPR3 bacterium RIFOXYB2_FULL